MRYYEQRYPEVDELVMVQVRQIAEMGAYVKLVCRFFSYPSAIPLDRRIEQVYLLITLFYPQVA